VLFPWECVLVLVGSIARMVVKSELGLKHLLRTVALLYLLNNLCYILYFTYILDTALLSIYKVLYPFYIYIYTYIYNTHINSYHNGTNLCICRLTQFPIFLSPCGMNSCNLLIWGKDWIQYSVINCSPFLYIWNDPIISSNSSRLKCLLSFISIAA
jgi:hypothetical protein